MSECGIVNCPGSDFPILNRSSEGPDLPQYEAVGYCCNGQQVWAYSLNSQDEADDNLQRLLVDNCLDCVEPRKYCADVKCGDVVWGKVCVSTSQSDADAEADRQAAALAPYCDSVESSTYCYTATCPDGSNGVTACSAISMADAQLMAESALAGCATTNDAQLCATGCPDGTVFWWYQAAGTIAAATKEEANARAYMLACKRAVEERVCLGDITLCCCQDQAYSAVIRANWREPGTTLNWQVVGGTFPPGLVFHGGLRSDSKCEIDGVPTAAGNYTFTVRATTLWGSYAQRAYTISVIAITTESLPEATVGTAYEAQLEATGGSGNYKFSIVSGTLPDGLTLADDGKITGTPTAAVSETITFEVIDLNCP